MFANIFSNFADIAQQTAHAVLNPLDHNNNANNNVHTHNNNGNKPPPASQLAIHNLSQVTVTADDLLEETNKECLICLVEQELGSISCKLPCGHLFHKDCVKLWLEKQCTCPVCRYEIGTDDQHYEKQRQQKMKQRKLRMRKDELKSKSITQLKELSRSLGVNIVGCFDKQDIVDKFCASGKIVITEGAPPVELTQSELMEKTVGELKLLLRSFGISTEGALYKSDLRKLLEDSGRVIVLDDDFAAAKRARSGDDGDGGDMKPSGNDEDDAMEEYDMVPPLGDEDIADIDEYDDCNNSKASPNVASSSSSSSSAYNSTKQPERNTFACSPSPSRSYSSSLPTTPVAPSSHSNTIHMDALKTLSVSALRDFCKRNHISTVGCLEKSEIVQRVLTSDNVHILHDEMPLPAHTDAATDAEESFTVQQLQAMSLSALKVVCTSYQIDIKDTHQADKLSLVEQMTASGKLKIVTSPAAHPSLRSPLSKANTTEKNTDAKQPSSSSMNKPASIDKMVLSRELLHDMSIRELRSILEAYNINSMGCVDKYDLITLLEECQVVIVE